MSSGLAKLQLLIDLKNNLKTGLDAAKKQVEKTTGQMQSKLDAFKASNMKMFDAIEERVPGMSNALNMLKNPYVAIAGVAMAAATAVGYTTAKAVEWDTKMAKVNVTAGLTKKELRGLSDQLMEIGTRNVAPLDEVPEAFNRIISAGLDANTSLQALEPTLRAAKAGFTDIETVAAAGVSVMQSSGEDINRVYDVLFATLNKGNAEFKDIAHYLPKVIPLARNVGFALDETAGAYAALTTKLSAEQSTTALQGMLRVMSDSKVVKKMEGIGVKVFDDKGKARPLLAIMQDLQKSMAGLTDKQKMLKFDGLKLDQEAMLGFSTLMQDIPNLKSSIDATVGSQGALNKAYQDSLTPLDDFKIVMNMISGKIIQIGQLFLPILTAIGRGALFVANNFDIVAGVIGGLAVAWGVLNAKFVAGAAIQGILAVKTALVTAAQWAFNVAASANPIGLIIMLIGALIGGLIVAYNKFDKFRAIVQGSWEVIKGFGEILKNYVIDRIKGVISGIGSIGQAIGLLFKGKFGEAFDTAKKGISDLSGFNAMKNAFESGKGLKSAFTNKYTASLAESKKKKAEEKENPKGDFAGVPTFDPKNNGGGGVDTPVSDAKKISGGGSSKITNIKIENVVKNLSPTHQSVTGMSKDELERWLVGIITRTIYNLEQT